MFCFPSFGLIGLLWRSYRELDGETFWCGSSLLCFVVTAFLTTGEALAVAVKHAQYIFCVASLSPLIG